MRIFLAFKPMELCKIMNEIKVIKRNNDVVKFDPEKIKLAVGKAQSRTDEEIEKLDEKVVRYVKKHLPEQESITVDDIHKLVENGIMNTKAFDTAREYVTYRKQHEPDIFRRRVAYKPFTYPELGKYVDAIQQSYWIVSEYSFGGDIQDFRVTLSPEEKESVRRSMLAISQVEVAVKKFWGNIGDRLPVPEIEEVGATFAESECHIAGTEILTPNGWVDFRDISVGDSVFQYHLDDGNVTPTKVLDVVNREYSGDIFHGHKRKMDFHVTPDHRFAIKNKVSGIVKEYTAEEAFGKLGSNKTMPTSLSLHGDIDHLSDKERLFIAIQADGHQEYHRANDGTKLMSGKWSNSKVYNVAFTKQRKIDRFKMLVDSTGYNYTTGTNDRGYTWFRVNVPDSDVACSLKTFQWVETENRSSEYFNEFIDELINWDGTIIANGVKCKAKYCTTSKECMDVVQMVGVLAGYRVSVETYADTRKESYKDTYTVRFNTAKSWEPANIKMDKYHYDGTIHCVTVDSGYIVTRYNNTVLVSGNCRHSRAYSHLLEILGLNDEFEGVLEVPAIKKRVTYAQKALSKAKTDSNKDFVESVLLFSLFIENVSLFSQFLIISQMNKEKGVLKGISNVISSTSLEEATHHDFGCALVNTIRSENPEWFDEELEERLYSLVLEAFDAEKDIVDWIFEEGELPYLSRDEVVEYVKNRFNMGLTQAGFKPAFTVDDKLIERTTWFDLQNSATAHTDFFAKRPPNYTKFAKSFDEDELF